MRGLTVCFGVLLLAGALMMSSAPGAWADDGSYGFRVAFVPEPGTGLLLIAGVLGLAVWRRTRA